MAATSESLVLALATLSDHVNTTPLLCQKFDLLVDTSQLIANTHAEWANNICTSIEGTQFIFNHADPLVQLLGRIETDAAYNVLENSAKINVLVSTLHTEENKSLLLRNRNKRNLNCLEKSLTDRISLATEIKRLQKDSRDSLDILANKSVAKVVGLMVGTSNEQNAAIADSSSTPVCVLNAAVDTYTLMSEGISKVLHC